MIPEEITEYDMYNELHNVANILMNNMNNMVQEMNNVLNIDIKNNNTENNIINNMVSDCNNLKCNKDYVVYPKNYENVDHISLDNKIKILENRSIIQNLFDKIWDEKKNKNYFKILNSSQVIYFFNFNIIYNSFHETYAYKYFFERMIEILYEFIYDLQIEGKTTDEQIRFYFAKVRKIENEGYDNYLEVIKEKIRIKYYELHSNKNNIQEYDKIIKNDPSGLNNTNEYLEMRKYINEYNIKKARIDNFKYPLINNYEKKIKEIEKLNLSILYLIPDYLQ